MDESYDNKTDIIFDQLKDLTATEVGEILSRVLRNLYEDERPKRPDRSQLLRMFKDAINHILE